MGNFGVVKKGIDFTYTLFRETLIDKEELCKKKLKD
jgi:hypothetical protein